MEEEKEQNDDMVNNHQSNETTLTILNEKLNRLMVLNEEIQNILPQIQSNEELYCKIHIDTNIKSFSSTPEQQSSPSSSSQTVNNEHESTNDSPSQRRDERAMSIISNAEDQETKYKLENFKTLQVEAVCHYVILITFLYLYH